MQQVIINLLYAAIIPSLVALFGKDRNIGYGWSFLLCYFYSPIVGLIIMFLLSKRIEISHPK